MSRYNLKISPNSLAYHVIKIELKRDVYEENQIEWIKMSQNKNYIKIKKNLITRQQTKF